MEERGVSEMVERVAIAMRHPYGEQTGFPVCPWSEAKTKPKTEWLACSRAAIEAMREPTGPMTRVGSAAIEDTDQEELDMFESRFWGQPWAPCANAAWQAMIDAALTTQSQGDGA